MIDRSWFDPIHATPVCCEDFRAGGLTGSACNFPMSYNAIALQAERNSTTPENLPWANRFASNAYMRDWLEQLGELRSKGELRIRLRSVK